MQRKKKAKGGFIKFIEYALVRVFVFFLMLWPFRLRIWIMERFTLLMGVVSANVRERVYGNIMASFPDRTPSEVKAIVKQNLRILARMTCEFYQEPRMKLPFIDRWIIQEPDAQAHRELSAEGGILVLGHLGSWEWMGVSITRVTEKELHVFAKRQSNPWSNSWIERIRGSQNIKLVYTDESPRVTFKLLKEKALVAFISDQDAGKDGAFFPFLGRLASTFQGPALFARKTDAPVIFCYSYHDARGRLRFHKEPFDRPSMDPREDPEEWDRMFTYTWVKRLEEKVREHPADYYWLHKRWRSRPEDPRQWIDFWTDWEKKHGFPLSFPGGREYLRPGQE
jgi:KDO2-lipid IV(A) lauroyltransferase